MKNKIILTLILTLFLAGCTSKADETIVEETKPKYVSTQIVEEKDFSEQIKLPGKVSASQETSISSLSSGIIDSILVNVGDVVKAGDVLATVDTKSNLANTNLNNAVTSYNNAVLVYNSTKNSLDKSIEAAKLQYDNAIISKNNTYSSTEKQLELAKAQLDAVSVQKGNTSQASTTSLDLAEKSLENAKISLENFVKNSEETLKTLETKKSSLMDSIKVLLESSFVSFDTSLNEIDKILGVTDLNMDYNKSFEAFLSAKNSQTKYEAINMFSTNNSSYKSLKAKYSKSFSEEELINYLNEMLSEVNKHIELLDKMVLVLNNSVTGANFSESELSVLKSTINQFQSSFTSLKSNIVTLDNSYSDVIDSINATNTSLVTQKASLEQAVKVAEATYENTKAGVNTNMDTVSSSEETARIQYESTVESVRAARETADNALKIAENQYISAKSSYDSQLASLKAQVDSAAGQKTSLSQQIENSRIVAPYDGIIISKNIEIGSTIGQGSVAFTIANSNAKIVKMDVNSENVKYLTIGKKVNLEKNSLTGEGVISIVGAGVNASTSMFPIEISITNTDFSNGVVLGDYVNVYIQKDVGNTKQIIIPFSALIANSDGTYGVYIVGEENIVTENKVEIGESNSREVIIKSGLNIGDKIVVSGALNISAGDLVEEK